MSRGAVRPRVRALLLKAGLDVRFLRPSTNPGYQRVSLLKHHGVTVVIDIGANVGQYALALREYGYAGAIVSFEPAPEAFRSLLETTRSDPAWSAVQLAITETEGNATLNITSNTVWTSLLHPEAIPVEVVARETVRTARLDSVADTIPPGRALLKVDAQGSEIRILEGAPATLRRSVVVELEFMLAEFYSGQPSARELIDFMYDRGFRLVGVENGAIDDETGEMEYCNGLFARHEDGKGPCRLITMSTEESA
jgi:FkbM family methyltransferase